MKVKPCICGTKIRKVTDASPPDSNLKTVYVQCPKCGLKGQIEMTKENAVWIWNHMLEQLAARQASKSNG